LKKKVKRKTKKRQYLPSTPYVFTKKKIDLETQIKETITIILGP
jgi:hypothetical protein